jgi:hypothetical protein
VPLLALIRVPALVLIPLLATVAMLVLVLALVPARSSLLPVSSGEGGSRFVVTDFESTAGRNCGLQAVCSHSRVEAWFAAVREALKHSCGYA